MPTIGDLIVSRYSPIYSYVLLDVNERVVHGQVLSGIVESYVGKTYQFCLADYTLLTPDLFIDHCATIVKRRKA